MKITVVTPSLNQAELLACCIASVADQQGIAVEHIIQDAGTPGFQEFSARMAQAWPDRPGYRRLMVSEPDEGMYDAINRGLRRGEGEICVYLNCDEQLLPGALAKVKNLFQVNPEMEILHGGFLVVDRGGQLVTAQRPVRLFAPHLMTSHLANFSCATFFKRRLLESSSAWFPAKLRACGDALWNLQRIREGVSTKTSPDYFSVFTETGTNQGLTPQSLKEREHLRVEAPTWMLQGAFLWKAVHRWRKLWAGGYFPQRINYEIWCSGTEEKKRKQFGPTWSTGIWKNRLGL